jgi:hypothetical protein
MIQMTNHPNRGRITIELIRHRSGFANVADKFTVREAGRPVDEYTEQTETYYLPVGYTVAECNAGSLQVYARDGAHCSIVEHNSGRPQLIGGGADRPVLKRKVAA